MFCVTVVYLWDITDTFSTILRLNVSHQSIFSSCLIEQYETIAHLEADLCGRIDSYYTSKQSTKRKEKT